MDPICSPLHNSHILPLAPAMCSHTHTTLQFSTNNKVDERVCKHSGVKEKLEQSRSVNSSKLQYRSHARLHSEFHEGKSRPPNDQVCIQSVIKDLEYCIHTLSEAKEVFIKIYEQFNVNSINESRLDMSVNTTSSQSRARPSKIDCGPDIIHQLATLKGCIQKLRRGTSNTIHMDTSDTIHMDTSDTIHMDTSDTIHMGTSDTIHMDTSDTIHMDTPDTIHLDTSDTIHMDTSDTINMDTLDTIHLDTSDTIHMGTSDTIYMDRVEELECAEEVVEIKVNKKLDTPQADVRVLDSPKQYNINETKRVILTPRTTLINVDIGSVEGVRVDMITDHEVLHAVKNILLAKINWSGDNSRSLQAAKRSVDHEIKKIENKKKLVEKLMKERKQNAEEIEHIKSENALKMKEEQAKVERFVLHLEGRDGILTDILDQLKAGRLTDVVKGLLLDFDVRLLGVDCGLNFLLEGPITLSDGSMLRQLQQILEELLPEEKRGDMKWENRTWDIAQGDDLEIGQVSPVSMQVTEDDNTTDNVGLPKDPNWTPSQFDQTQISSNTSTRVPFIQNRIFMDEALCELIHTIVDEAKEMVRTSYLTPKSWRWLIPH